ncbi:MAG: NPCBM/NEW2 domain-containing protein [Clostridia bacterium]|nr:NPCBM/NEW2 domain-containing protein [Clostridia bacterium]
MKKRTKSIIAGLVVGATLAGTSLIAANTITLYNVVANGVKIVIDGQKITPTDANGNAVEPIIYNGTTYLPVRAVANAFGKAVYWDGPTYTVYLGDMDGKLEYPTVELRDLESIADEHSIDTEPEDNYGTRYTYALKGHPNQTYEYLVNMKYSKLKGVLYVNADTSSIYTSTFEIIADGRRIYTSPVLDKTSRPIPLDINITGYNDIKIVFKGDMSRHLRFSDAGFYQ